jgi:hypothetical protein
MITKAHKRFLAIMVAIFGGFKTEFSGPVIFTVAQKNTKPHRPLRSMGWFYDYPKAAVENRRVRRPIKIA